ncbi:peptide chain release factor 3 [Billgrantia montanilacus]|uniref:Peptide chain release factor 3 n=1 Tax=Billgrantia montanilacus TaxID=2282305 RepID=A0A368U3R2_9GAMM|nr:peptide chain release factor 3 [Halomonas montanilacus]RCV91708.1 peptide chain release factor 3 [Halomonas montanilacus]
MSSTATVNTATSLPQEVARRRTFAIISHPDAGKTTLTEKLLMYGGAIRSAGTVKGKKSNQFATSDWMEVEKQRGISVASSVMQFEHEGCVINLLDTPGHQDFSEDTYRVLTAVDAALMVIDAAKGVEAQTIKLLEVCRLRKTPVITFINKMDREVRDPLELIDEIEDILKLDCAPVTWPVGMGKQFAGVYDLHRHQMLKFTPGDNTADSEVEVLDGEDHPYLVEHFPIAHATFKEEVEIVREAASPFDHQAFLAGDLSPVFFGSAINNFGVRDILQALVSWAPSPRPREARQREVLPDEADFTGIVFKIQANMNPLHRDRIAFLRICSGEYRQGLRATHLRSGKSIKLDHAITFMAQERSHLSEAYAGDIIGIPNHGRLRIGDVITQGETLKLEGIPHFSPEIFRVARLNDPLRAKQLNKALQELGEEGTIQVFEPLEKTGMVLGAVGQLQFETVAHRLLTEYKIDASFDSVPVHKALWVSSADAAAMKRFLQSNASRLARDAAGALAFMAPNRSVLQLTIEKWPEIEFHSTREVGAT